MEADEYARLAQQEDVLWWFGLLHRNLFAVLDALGLQEKDLACADFGCGTGGLVGNLETRFPGGFVIGLDRSAAALAFARRKHGSPFVLGDASDSPFKADSLDAVFVIDVMCHREVQPDRMLEGIFASLRPGGIVILNNPAYEWMRSYHDVFVHTARRYTTRDVAADLGRAGFEVVRCTYWNTILFPLMVLKRKVLAGAASRSDVDAVAPWINRLFSLASLPEPLLLRYGINLPFGGSVLAIGRKGP